MATINHGIKAVFLCESAAFLTVTMVQAEICIMVTDHPVVMLTLFTVQATDRMVLITADNDMVEFTSAGNFPARSVAEPRSLLLTRCSAFGAPVGVERRCDQRAHLGCFMEGGYLG